MSEDHHNTSTESFPGIRIERLNADKTRKEPGSDTVYHVYFQLSGHPPPEWRSIFRQEWKKADLVHEASIDGSFLVLHSQLHDIASRHLPALKIAVAATNDAYSRYAREEAAALQRRKHAWKQDRDDVDAMGASLDFDSP